MARARRPGHHRRMTIQVLVVDDSELILTSLSTLLHSVEGIATVLTANTLAGALDLARLKLPELVILDLHLPEGNAIEIIGLMKQTMPGIKIAVLTNDASRFSRKRCMTAGADWFFDKSTEFRNVLDVARTQAALQ
jgi:two-component system OmpR family response regulator